MILIDQQTIGCHQQISPWFLQCRQGVQAQQFDEGVVGHVGCIVGAAELFAQPAEQPAVMPTVKLGKGRSGLTRHDETSNEDNSQMGSCCKCECCHVAA